MLIEFVANTGFYLSHRGKVFVHDLWMSQGAFEGSWYHFPPLVETEHRPDRVDYFYVSHIHPDHYDEATLPSLSKSAVGVVPAYFNHLMRRNLQAMGFSQVRSLAPGASAELAPGLRVHLYGQFVNNLFHEAEVGNLIDSAIVVEWDGYVMVNCNDNYPDAQSAQKIKARFPQIDVALVPHSASGPYPSCFMNLTEAQKIDVARRFRTDYLDHFLRITEIFGARFTIPCAAEYVIAGAQHAKTRHLGTIPAHEAAPYAAERGVTASTVVPMTCGNILDVDTGQVSGTRLRTFTSEEKCEFARSLASVRYPYEAHPLPGDDLHEQVAGAWRHLHAWQQKLNWFDPLVFCLETPGGYRAIMNFASHDVARWDGRDPAEPFLKATLDDRLLLGILEGRCHWNNAEGGVHIDYFRSPDRYVPEAHVMLSFFHLPRKQMSAASILRPQLQSAS